MDNFNFIASIVTLLSAIWTFYNAYKVKKNLSIIEKVKFQIIEKRNYKELTNLYRLTKKVQNIFSKYGFALTDSSLKGVDFKSESTEMQNYLNTLIDNTHFFSDDKQKTIKEIHKELGIITKKLINSNKKDEVMMNGIKINDNISQISTMINKMIFNLEYQTNE